jgi:NADPH:quinone reductase-like Zn-dependent oxidoreductase
MEIAGEKSSLGCECGSCERRGKHMAMMRAAVIRQAGSPEVLKIESIRRPEPSAEQVLIRVRAFGINRSELFTRRGQSPDVTFPRVLGIEAVGEVASAPGGQFATGEIVATAMGGMGRQFDGGYAEYACVPVTQVQAIKTSLGWDTLGALPEMLQTAWGSLFRALRLKTGERLLVRGGTTSVGLAAAAIAKSHGAIVISTSRNPAREDLLRQAGADRVVIDNGAIAGAVEALPGGRADKVLELIDTTTLADSLRCASESGIVCMMGMVGDKWSFDNFSPMEVIPTGVCLTTYDGGTADFMRTPLQKLVEQVEAGSLRAHVGKVFHLDQIAEAHRLMEDNKAGGKIVVLTS